MLTAMASLQRLFLAGRHNNQSMEQRGLQPFLTSGQTILMFGTWRLDSVLNTEQHSVVKNSSVADLPIGRYWMLRRLPERDEQQKSNVSSDGG